MRGSNTQTTVQVEPPTNWLSVPLGDLLAAIEAGRSFKCEERPPQVGEAGIVKVSAVTWGTFDELESKTCPALGMFNPGLLIESGDFLFSRANTLELVGACVLVGKIQRRLMLSDKILRFRFMSEPDLARWVLWFLRSHAGRRQIESLATGNQHSMRNIGQDRIRQIRIPLAPKGERLSVLDAIETQLTRLDAAVAALERVQANLKRYRASVLKAAVEGRLVQIEAELARQEGRDYEPASVLLQRILAERRRRWEEAELAAMQAKGRTPKDGKWKAKYEEPVAPNTEGLPDLPEGWSWASPDQLAATDEYSLGIGPFGSNLKVTDYASFGVPLIFVRNIRSGVFGGSETKYVSLQKADELRPHWTFPGDILITKMGEPPGDACIHPLDASTAVITADCIKWRLATALSSRSYFVSALLSDLVRRRMIEITKGVAQKKVSLARFKTVAIPVPPLAEQERIAGELERLISVGAATASQVGATARRSQRVRQSILKWAFEGKLADQDPTDEPASVLLERIRVEREAERPAARTRLPAKRTRRVA